MIRLAALLSLTSLCSAAPIPLLWDDEYNAPVDRIVYYTVWQRVGTQWQIVKSSNTRETVIDRKNGTYEFVVTAVDAWGYHSPHSNTIRVRVHGNRVQTL